MLEQRDMGFGHRWANLCKTLASLATSPLTNFIPPLKLIRYFQV